MIHSKEKAEDKGLYYQHLDIADTAARMGFLEGAKWFFGKAQNIKNYINTNDYEQRDKKRKRIDEILQRTPERKRS